MSRTRYFVNRTLYTVVLLWAILTFLFFLFRLMPGSASSLLALRGAQPETIEQFRQLWGLDKPLYVQYWIYLTNFLTGNFGHSFQTGEPVLKYVSMNMLNTFILVAPGMTVAYLLGGLLGSVFGSKRGSKLERYGILPAFIFGTFPIFFLGIIAIIVFSVHLNLLPTGGLLSSETAVRFKDAQWWRPYFTLDFLAHFILPFSVIVIRYTNTPLLVMRTSMAEVIGQDFSRYYRITGLSGQRRLRHLIKHASLPLITLYPVSMLRAISGLVLLEVVFNWPGIGKVLVDSVLARDYAVAQFVFFLAALFVIFGNYFVDIAYGVIDPRVSVADE